MSDEANDPRDSEAPPSGLVRSPSLFPSEGPDSGSAEGELARLAVSEPPLDKAELSQRLEAVRARASSSPSAPPPAPELSEEVLPEGRLRDALAQLVQLHSVTTDMSQAQGELEIIRRAVVGARQQLGIDRVAVFLHHQGGIAGTYGTSELGEVVDETYFRGEIPAHPMVERALAHQDYVAVEENVPLYLADRIVGHGWNAMIALWDGGSAIGWIACDNLFSGRALEPFQKEILKLLGSSLAQSIVRARAAEDLISLNRELERRVVERTERLAETNLALEEANAHLLRLSHADGLTGIANRRLFNQAYEKEWARALREHSQLSLVILDVDFFKLYNDSCGHQRGDEVLKSVASALETCLHRPADLAARYGGEEFVVLLPQTPAAGAEAVAENIRRAILDLQIAHPQSEVSEFVSVSVGVNTVVVDSSESPLEEQRQQALEAADRALYRAKASGRNRVCGA